MPPLAYLDFDLLIEPVPGRYRARVLNSPAGNARNEFLLPFTNDELESLLSTLAGGGQAARLVAAKTLGGQLFEAIFTNELGNCLRSSRDLARSKASGLRIRLRLHDVPELAVLPWEYLYERTVDSFLFLSRSTLLVRYLELPSPIRTLMVHPPLRILVMIATPYGQEKVEGEQEWRKLQAALKPLEQQRLVILDRLSEATLSALQARLRQEDYHIFHFVGHGTFDKVAQQGALLLEDSTGTGRPVMAQELGYFLGDHSSLKLVVLNACESASSSKFNLFAGVAQGLVQQGIAAVIAMQSVIADESAVTFGQEFYRVTAEGYPVDVAVAEARKAIFAQHGGLEWGIPVLYLRSPDGHIFDITFVDYRVGLQVLRNIIARSELKEELFLDFLLLHYLCSFG